MHVLAVLPPSQLTHLKSVLEPIHQVTAVLTSGEMTEMARTRLIDAVLVDPGTTALLSVAEVVTFLRAFPSLPVIPYISMSARAMRAVSQLSSHGIAQVIIHRVDDSPPRLIDALRARQSDPLARMVLVRIEAYLARLSVSVRGGVELLFRDPHTFFTVGDLADAARVNPRTIYRQFAAAGLASPHVVVLCARLLRGYLWLRDPAHASSDVEHKLGFSSRQQFARALSRFTGTTPRAVRRRPDDARFVERVVLLLTTPAPADHVDPAAAQEG